MSDVRKVQTGEDENGNPIEVYEFGAEVDGTFVPFVTKAASYIEHLRDARKDNEPAQAAAPDATPTHEDEE
jgi:hypothetical protein